MVVANRQRGDTVNIRYPAQIVLTAGALLAFGAVHAATAEQTKAAKSRSAPASAAHAASGAVTKAEKAVKSGAKATEKGIQTGVKAANKGADNVASKVGLPPGKAPAEPKAP
jgi:hypothetical protein